MKPAPFDLVAAGSVPEAIGHLQGDDGAAKLVAGSQSLGPMLNLRLARPSRLVQIGQVDDLRGVEARDDAVVYGAAITHAEIEDGRVPDATPGWLPAIARRIAYRAVRTRGTLGGSLVHADPAADWVVTLTALGASVRMTGPDGAREMPVADFVTGALATALAPDEIVTGVRVPRPGPSARWGYWKFCRKLGEFAKASAAILADPDRDTWCVVAGAIERKPVRLSQARAIVAGDADLPAILKADLSFLAAERLALQATATCRALAALSAQSGAATETAAGSEA